MPVRSSTTKTRSTNRAPKKATVKKSSTKRVSAAKMSAAKKTTRKKITAKSKPVTPKKVPATAPPPEPPRPIPAPAYTFESVTQIKRAPLGHLLTEQRLREAGFRGGISTNRELLNAYSTDESIFAIRPQVVLQPKDRRDVEIAVRVIRDNVAQFPALSLTPRAAGTGLSGGSLTDSVVIDVTKHMHQFGDVTTKQGVTTFTCEPGTPWRVVERHLKKHNVYLPPAPASKDICTIGGAVANNAAGRDSLQHGHCAAWITSLDVTLADGNTYTIKPLTYREYKNLTTKDNAHATIAKAVFTLIEHHEKMIQRGRPRGVKNTAGYAIWDVLDTSVAAFKRGRGHFDLTQLIAGSQGTIGIITSLTMRTAPIPKHTELLAIPLFDLAHTGDVINALLEYEPLNIELYDGLTYDLAMKHPEFFRSRFGKLSYYRAMFMLYSTYHVRYGRKLPELTILTTFDTKQLNQRTTAGIAKTLRQKFNVRPRAVVHSLERELHWQLRRASYPLSKLQNDQRRPAAFLEDIAVPPKQLAKFFLAIRKLLRTYQVTATVHGHGGNGHLHFYPLLDFTNKTTPKLIDKMAEEFFTTAAKFDGSLCGEHNDGIIRTPHLDKMFSKQMMKLFAEIEHIFDPDDIFNPGKKVNPRYQITESIRTTN